MGIEKSKQIYFSYFIVKRVTKQEKKKDKILNINLQINYSYIKSTYTTIQVFKVEDLFSQFLKEVYYIAQGCIYLMKN